MARFDEMKNSSFLDRAGYGEDYDGYTEFGGIGPLSEAAAATQAAWSATGHLPDDFRLLRGSLFYESRRLAWQGDHPDPTTTRFRDALLAHLQALVEAMGEEGEAG